MVSSTTKDLEKHRKEATDAVLRMRMFPLVMETLGATGGNAISDSIKLANDADVYIGIFGKRYGYVPDDAKNNPKEISITQMEYERAIERGIPVRIFVMHDTHPSPTVGELEGFIEQTEEGKKKHKALVDHLTTEHVVHFFKDETDLRAAIIQALALLRDEVEDDNDEDDEDDEEADPESLLPKPPELYAKPTYSLTTTFIGRTRELSTLDAWAQSDDIMMIVEAIGGMGKSAVTWQWVQTQTVRTFDGVIWWSFYESGATMGAFVRHALGYVTGTSPDDYKGRDVMANFTELQSALREGHYLLALDGLERVLVAYHRWNAAQMRGDEIGDAEAIIKDRDVRTCTDPKDKQILEGLLTCTHTKVLMTSRLILIAVENEANALRPEVKHIHLNGLDPDDALTLTRAQGIAVENERQFKNFMKTFGYHSLLVMLVAGRVNKYRRARGNFDAWYARVGRDLTVSQLDLKQQQTHILQFAFDGLDKQQDRFLSQIAAFGDAVDYETMAVFNPFVKVAPQEVKESNIFFEEYMLENAETEEEKAKYQKRIEDKKAPYEAYLKEKEAYEQYLKSADFGEAESDFDDLLGELEERGLLRWNRDKDTYDMHPVVRGYAFDRLEGDQKTGTFERIEGHFRAQPADDVESAKEVADLTNTITIYRALVGAGKLDEAARFFDNLLRDQLCQRIAAYYTVIELLTPLFGNGTNTLPTLTEPHFQDNITNTIANMFYYVGRKDEAIVLEGLQLKLNIDQDDDADNLGIGLRNYAISLESNNQPMLAQQTIELALALAEATDSINMIARSRVFMLGIYKNTGQWEDVEATYKLLQDAPPREIYWQTDIEKYYAEILIYRGLDAQVILDKAEQLANASGDAHSLRQIQRWYGEVALQAGNAQQAKTYFEDALKQARKQGSVEVATYLGCLARANITIESERSYARIEEALGQTYKEEIHDLYVSIAETYLALDDKEDAKDYAIKAYKAAWADGPPYVWWWYLERAKAVLDALGEPYPEMPPFDPDKIGKIPHEDEIRAYIRRKGGDV